MHRPYPAAQRLKIVLEDWRMEIIGLQSSCRLNALINALDNGTLFAAAFVFAGTSVDFNFVTDFNEQWNGNFEAGCNFGRLQDLS